MFTFGLLILFVAVPTAISGQKSTNGIEISERVFGGNPVPVGKYPYVCSLQKNNFHWCGAVIVNQLFVLTTAYCTSNNNPAGYSVYVGTVDKTQGGARYPVASFTIHPKFDRVRLVSDLALVKLQSALLFNNLVAPAPLPKRNQMFAVGSVGSFMGWGASPSSPYSIKLLEAPLPLIGDQECSKIFSDLGYWPTLPDETMCARVPTAGAGACWGDGGGPYIIDGVVAGLSSFQLPTCGAVTGCVEVPNYVDWILCKSRI